MNENIVLTEAVYYILLSLKSPMHGYGIMQNTARLSSGRVNLAAGTLYGAITTMLEKGWIKPVQSDEDSRKKEYQITDCGTEVVLAEMKRLKELFENGNRVFKEV